MPQIKDPSFLCLRLKTARKAAGLSQKQLGINIGLDEFVASTRINRYEVGVHEPDLGTMRRIAKVLSTPLPFFYTDDDIMADMILAFAGLDNDQKNILLAQAKAATSS
ncbi:helix-turn-helix domain-containing protein [Kerstersia sp.]|uniref:helix-turn-helix domain-containing protein n=1 Tax=Kerstersia sp. TaxID=1930783 RepID=UPI003F925D05